MEKQLNLPSLPFKGLESFRYADREIFSEREEEKLQLISLIQIYRGSLLYGQSGIGKSSLIAAGLIPLVEKNYQPEIIRVYPTEDGTFIVSRIEFTENKEKFLPSIFDSINRDEKNAKINVSIADFKETIQKKRIELNTEQKHKSSLLIFDQFEELIALFEECGSENSQAKVLQEKIITLLQNIYYDSSLNIKLLFVFREDYLAKFTKLFEVLPDLSDHFLRLTAIPVQRLESIISYPFVKDKDSIKYKHSFSELFCKTLADELVRYFKGTLVLTEVQIISLFLYNRVNERQKWMNEKHPVKAILQKYYVNILDQFDVNEKEIAICILSILVLNERTRNIFHHDAIIKEYLVQNNKKADNTIERQKCEIILEKLVNKNPIIRKETRGDGVYYEIKSEAIIPFINERKIEKIKIHEFAKKRKKLILVLVFILTFVGTVIGFYLKEFNIEREKFYLAKQRSENKIQKDILKQNELNDKIERTKDSLKQEKQKSEIERKKLDLANQKYEINRTKDSLKQEKQKSEIERKKLDLANQKHEINRTKDSLKQEKQKSEIESEKYLVRTELANSLAITSLNLSTNASFEKSSLAKLAYDTLIKFRGGQKNEVFNPKVYEALLEGLLPNFTNKQYYNYSIIKNYFNIEGIIKSDNNYYMTLPFKSVVNKQEIEVVSDTNIIHAWVNSTNTMVAIVLADRYNKTKKLVIKDLLTKTNLNEVILDIDEDVVSLIFNKTNAACIFSTKFPYKRGKGKVCRLKIKSNEKYSSIFKCENNEYMFLKEKGNNQIFGITNLGNFVQWKEFELDHHTVQKLFSKGITAISYNTNQQILYVSYENGKIERMNSNNKPELFSQGSENSKITQIASSSDGKWLAAGSINGCILLWKLDTLRSDPATLLRDFKNDNFNNNNAISGICFELENNTLIASTRSGIVYKFPLSMESMASKICAERKFIETENIWNNSLIPESIKFKRACRR